MTNNFSYQAVNTAYNPKCNGLCEWINGVLKSMVKKMCQERPKDCDRYLQAVLYAYREVPQVSTRFSPFENMQEPWASTEELWTGDETSKGRNTYQDALDLRSRHVETCRLEPGSLYKAQWEQKHHYDKKSKNRQFEWSRTQGASVAAYQAQQELTLQWRGSDVVEEVVNRGQV